MNIEVAEERTDDALVLLPVGRLDSSNARAFESIVMERIGGGERRLIVDFSRLDFISSAGMRVLLIAAKALKTADGSLVLCAMKNHIPGGVPDQRLRSHHSDHRVARGTGERLGLRAARRESRPVVHLARAVTARRLASPGASPPPRPPRPSE